MHNSRFYNFILSLSLKNILNYISYLLLFSSLIIFLTTFISLFFKERGEFSLVFKIIGLTHAQSLKLSFLLILTNFILKNVDNLIWNPLDIEINRNFNIRILVVFLIKRNYLKFVKIANIQFNLPTSATVTLSIVDLNGKVVSSNTEKLNAGNNKFMFKEQ